MYDFLLLFMFLIWRRLIFIGCVHFSYLYIETEKFGCSYCSPNWAEASICKSWSFCMLWSIIAILLFSSYVLWNWCRRHQHQQKFCHIHMDCQNHAEQKWQLIGIRSSFTLGFLLTNSIIKLPMFLKLAVEYRHKENISI